MKHKATFASGPLAACSISISRSETPPITRNGLAALYKARLVSFRDIPQRYRSGG